MLCSDLVERQSVVMQAVSQYHWLRWCNNKTDDWWQTAAINTTGFSRVNDGLKVTKTYWKFHWKGTETFSESRWKSDFSRLRSKRERPGKFVVMVSRLVYYHSMCVYLSAQCLVMIANPTKLSRVVSCDSIAQCNVWNCLEHYKLVSSRTQAAEARLVTSVWFSTVLLSATLVSKRVACA